MLRAVRNILISVVALAVLFTAAGVAYVLVVDKNEKQDTAVLPETTPKESELFKPRQPNPKAPVGASVESLLTPVKAGQNTSITIATTPSAICKIVVKYDETKARDSGLIARKANNFGRVTWTWTVDRSVPAGKWPVDVTCAYNKRSAMVRGDLVVEK